VRHGLRREVGLVNVTAPVHSVRSGMSTAAGRIMRVSREVFGWIDPCSPSNHP
jgi:hypothetical protein